MTREKKSATVEMGMMTTYKAKFIIDAHSGGR